MYFNFTSYNPPATINLINKFSLLFQQILEKVLENAVLLTAKWIK